MVAGLGHTHPSDACAAAEGQWCNEFLLTGKSPRNKPPSPLATATESGTFRFGRTPLLLATFRFFRTPLLLLHLSSLEDLEVSVYPLALTRGPSFHYLRA